MTSATTVAATGGRPTRVRVTRGGRPVPGLWLRDGRVYEAKAQRHGRTYRRTLTAATVTDAEREARAFIASLDAGTRPTSRTDTTLRELRDQWAAWATGPISDLAPRTVALYRDQLDRRVLPLLGERTPAASVTTGDARRMIDRLRAQGHSGASVRHAVNALSSVMRYGVRTGTVEANPIRGLERGDRPSGKRQTEPRYLNASQIAVLVGRLGDEFRAVAACCAYAGLRVSEALALRWEHVRFGQADGWAHGWLDVPGTKTAAARRSVPMSPELARELRAHRTREAGRELARVKPDRRVFVTARGNPQSRRNALRAVHHAGDVLGLNPDGAERVGLHDLRHSAAALLLAAGVPLPRVAAILGHANTHVTATVYAGLVESQRAELGADLAAAFS